MYTVKFYRDLRKTIKQVLLGETEEKNPPEKDLESDWETSWGKTLKKYVKFYGMNMGISNNHYR